MSVRHRQIAGSPERSASDAASTVISLITETLSAATAVDQAEVDRETDSAAAGLRMLIAGKHLASSPLVLCAPPLRLEISVVCGDKAASVDENLAKVPGAASASDWTLHVPAPSPIDGWIESALRDLTHITTDAPPTVTASLGASAVTSGDIDIDVLRRVGGGT